MSNNDININTDTWVTQQMLAVELKTSVQRVHNWIKRGKITSKFVPELNITLVDKTSINIDTINK